MTEPASNKQTKASVESVLAEFDGKQNILSALCTRTGGLIEELLQHEHIRYQLLQSRVKGRNKLRTKYLDPTKDYKELNDITDQAGFRIITYYEDEADAAAKVIEREFDIDRERSVDKRATEPSKFGYYALNYVCKYSGDRTTLSEYRRFADIWFEIQITSVLRHAWSEMEHPWYDLRDAFPENIQRRFARMAALLEVAESEFLSLKTLQGNYVKSVDVLFQSQSPELPIDAVSVKSFIEQDPIVGEVDAIVSAALGCGISEDLLADRVLESRSKAAKLAGLKTLQELRGALLKNREAIPEFITQWRAQKIFAAPPPGFEMHKSVCIFHLALFLVSIIGEEQATRLMSASGLQALAPGNLTRLISIAREIARKYPQ